MVKDRLNELLEKSEFKDLEDTSVQEHDRKILHNQKQILQDLKQFSEISRWIDDLQQNILDIEVNLFADENDNGDTGSVNVSQRLDENANLCFKIFNAVKRLQEDLDKLKQQQQNDDTEEEEGLVNLVRRTQFDNIKTAYIDAYWKYNAVVRRYEDEIKDKSLVATNCAPKRDSSPRRTEFPGICQPAGSGQVRQHIGPRRLEGPPRGQDPRAGSSSKPARHSNRHRIGV
ncbi:interaptin-like [Ochlerotatus camptorhynchus]|uniref:interaptin-like n=1 Tax=Ochlerotatus camptorhynchus TaxID=644619 RepID=UPI0031D1538F